jgi:predicted RNase H-like nuclease
LATRTIGFAEEGGAAVMAGRVVGVDAAGGYGWVGVVVSDDGFEDSRVGTLNEILAWAEPVDVLGIDIPIGHVIGGIRRADAEARRFVGPRGSSVFPAPPTEAFTVDSFVELNAALAEQSRPMLSRQAWALVPKIVEAAEIANADARVFEVHPEVSFREMAGEFLPWAKKSWNGLQLRLRLLRHAGIDLPQQMPDIAGSATDDVVDAAAAAWSARRILGGAAKSLPDPPEQCAGRQVAIWC